MHATLAHLVYTSSLEHDSHPCLHTSAPQELLAFWCTELGHASSPKCKQMEFGKRMQQTESGEERKRMAMEFR